MTRTIIHSVVVFDGILALPSLSTVVFDSVSGLIESVAPTEETSNSPIAENDPHVVVLDGTGYTLMPGLIDAHVHLQNLDPQSGADHGDVLKQPLTCGVTTVCDMHCDEPTIRGLREQVASEMDDLRKQDHGGNARVTRSDLKSCLLAATIKDGWPKPIVLALRTDDATQKNVASWPNVTSDGAMEYVLSQKSSGADYIKLMQEDGCALAIPTGSMPSATLDLQKAVVQAAHAQDMKVVAHAMSLDNTTLVLEAGVDGLAHSFFDQAPTPAIVEQYKKTGAFMIPTLTALSGLADEEHAIRAKHAAAALDLYKIDKGAHDLMLETHKMSAPTSRLQYALDSVRQLHQAGIDIVAGTDSLKGMKGMAMGPSLWMELDLYVERCGMTPAAALRAATETGSRRLGLVDRGVIRSGKRADLLLVRGRPFESIQALWQDGGIAGVWKEGIRAV